MPRRSAIGRGISMWWLVVLLLSPLGNGTFYVKEAHYPNRQACLTAESKYGQSLGRLHIAARTACVYLP